MECGVTDCVFTNCSGMGSGGCIYGSSGINFNIASTYFVRCGNAASSNQRGGVLYFSGTSLVIDRCVFSKCYSIGGFGGVIYGNSNLTSVITISNSRFYANNVGNNNNGHDLMLDLSNEKTCAITTTNTTSTSVAPNVVRFYDCIQYDSTTIPSTHTNLTVPDRVWSSSNYHNKNSNNEALTCSDHSADKDTCIDMSCYWRTDGSCGESCLDEEVEIGTTKECQTQTPAVKYVANGGSDTGACNSVSAKCLTVRYAYERRAGESPLEVRVGVNQNVETKEVNVTSTLRVIGESQTMCALLKTNDSAFVLFTLDTANANLTIANLTLLLTNHSGTGNYVRSSGVNVKVWILFEKCRISMESGLSWVRGESFFIDNSEASLGFAWCKVYNISTNRSQDMAYPIVYADSVSTLWISYSSFANMGNHGGNTTIGGLFYLKNETGNLTVVQSVFVMCRSTGSCGVGYVGCLKSGGSVIISCVFWNDSSVSSRFGTLFLGSSNSFNGTVDVSNTSFIHCRTVFGDRSGGGSALHFKSYLRPVLRDCRFTNCSAPSNISNTYGRGGALYFDDYVSASVLRCTFARCNSPRGGALCMENYTRVYLTDCVFVGNAGTYYAGADVYVDNAQLWINNSYTDANDSISIYCIASNNEDFNCTAFASDTCSDDFSSEEPIDGRCAMPCVSASGACVEPDKCPTGLVADRGRCVADCISLPSSSCTLLALCIVDSSLGYPLCTAAPCSQRTVDSNPANEFPCGDSNCFADPTSNNTCVAVCTERRPHALEGENWPCGDPSDDFSAYRCYLNVGRNESDVSQPECATFPSNPFFEISTDEYGPGNSKETGKFTLLPCVERVRVDTLETNQCGPDTDGNNSCVWDHVAGTTHCSTSCTEPSSHVPDTTTHVCVERLCTQYEDGDEEGCLSSTKGCVIRTNGSCNSSCHDVSAHDAHYDTVDGRCSLQCAYREPELGSCGVNETCFYDPTTSACVEYCPLGYSEDRSAGQCSTKTCAECDDAIECGAVAGCVVRADGTTCRETCADGEESNNYEVVEDEGGYRMCRLDCPHRTPVPDAASPCWDNEKCFYKEGDSDAGGTDKGTCVEECAVPMFPSPVRGMCLKIRCEDIAGADTEDLRRQCTANQCVIRSDGACRVTCAEEEEDWPKYTLDASGVCTLKCQHRPPQANSATPCGNNTNCFYDSDEAENRTDADRDADTSTAVDTSTGTCTTRCSTGKVTVSITGRCRAKRCAEYDSDDAEEMQQCVAAGCVVLSTGECGDDCGDDRTGNYARDETHGQQCWLRCVLRKSNLSNPEPCEDNAHCFHEEEREKCVSNCAEGSYASTDRGLCLREPCEDVAVESCFASGCVLRENDTEKCWANCTDNRENSRHYTVNGMGHCVLKCDYRKPIVGDVDVPCGDNSNCFRTVESGSESSGSSSSATATSTITTTSGNSITNRCVARCPNNEMENTSRGTCRAKVCDDRGGSAEECRKDPACVIRGRSNESEIVVCSSTCDDTNPGWYDITTDAVCMLRCTHRTPADSPSSAPCGDISHCFLYSNIYFADKNLSIPHVCVEKCPARTFLSKNRGICIPSTCEETAEEFCQEAGCVIRSPEEKGGCSLSCADLRWNRYEVDADGFCSLRCMYRTPDPALLLADTDTLSDPGNTTRPCGNKTGCFYDASSRSSVSGGIGMCTEYCPDGYVGDSTTGRCRALDCHEYETIKQCKASAACVIRVMIGTTSNKNTRTCDSTCDDTHPEKYGTVDRVCELQCSARAEPEKNDENYPCSADCVKRTTGECRTTCTDDPAAKDLVNLFKSRGVCNYRLCPERNVTDDGLCRSVSDGNTKPDCFAYDGHCMYGCPVETRQEKEAMASLGSTSTSTSNSASGAASTSASDLVLNSTSTLVLPTNISLSLAPPPSALPRSPDPDTSSANMDSASLTSASADRALSPASSPAPARAFSAAPFPASSPNAPAASAPLTGRCLPTSLEKEDEKKKPKSKEMSTVVPIAIIAAVAVVVVVITVVVIFYVVNRKRKRDDAERGGRKLHEMDAGNSENAVSSLLARSPTSSSSINASVDNSSLYTNTTPSTASAQSANSVSGASGSGELPPWLQNSTPPKAGGKKQTAKANENDMTQTQTSRLPVAFGAYLVVKALGRGSFGEVFEVTKESVSYAIKAIDARNRTADTELAFANNVSACMNSKFLVRYYETIRGSQDEVLVVMELCRQGDLNSLIESVRKAGKDNVLDPSRILKILIQLVLGLEVLHRSKILHRDLKPDNIFIDAEDNVKIGDFGCAKVLESMTEEAHTCIGTPLYESPEVIKGEPYSFSSDMWSLGVLMYELCMLKRPFTHPSKFVLMQIIMSGAYKPISKLRCPDQLRDIIHSLLTMDPKKRPTAMSILQIPFIREYAEEFELLEYFPAVGAVDAVAYTVGAASSSSSSSSSSPPPSSTLPSVPALSVLSASPLLDSGDSSMKEDA